MNTRAWRMGVVMALLAATAIAAWGAPYAPILMGEAQFDPKCAEPAAVVAARAAQASAMGSTISSDRNYYVVQFQGPVRSAWKRQAADLGAVLLDYIPRYAFVTRMTAAEATQVTNLPCVRWVGPFPSQWKYRKSLIANKQRGLTVTVQLYPGEILDRVGQFVRDRNLWCVGFSWAPRPAVRLRMPAGAVPDLAALPEVAWIQEYKLPELHNDQGQRYLNVSNVSGLPGGIDVWQDYSLFGGSQIVAVADTGLDTGNPATLHPDFLDAAGLPRLAAAQAWGRPNDWSDSTEPPVAAGSHGTHVAGSVLGNGAMSGSDPAGAYYTGSFAGMAPEARLVFQSIMDSAGWLTGVPSNYGQLFDRAYGAGARIHTNSWGASYYFGGYTYESFTVDDYLWRRPEMTILYSAGNDGYDWDADGVVDSVSIGQPATAKNCVTVGATESYRPPLSGWGGYADFTWGELWWYPADPIASDYTSDDPSGMAAFSSRGPCLDGRIKPDVVTPGTNIISCRSRGKYGDYSGVDEGWGVYDDWYLYGGGTSMATPLTAGAAALVREYYEVVRGHAEPTGSLIKATLIHGAVDLAPGQYGTGPKQEIQPRPDQSQGWGRPSIGASVHPERIHPGISLIFHDYGMIQETGAVDIHPVVVTSAGTPLAITLAWTDYPGAPYVYEALVNDLNLVVVDPRGVRYRGNFGAQPYNDRVNNVERLEFPTPVVGNYYIQIWGNNVPRGPQPYSMVVTGTTATTYSISGRITDVRDRPVSGVAVTVEGINTVPGRRVTGGTRADGTYEITNLLPGRYRVTPSKEYHAFTPVDRRPEIVAADVTGVDFTATVSVTLQISGYVWDQFRRGVPGIAVNVYEVASRYPPFFAEDILAVYPAVTGADGRYRVTGLEPGFYYIEPEQVLDRFITPPYNLLALPSREANSQNFWISPLWYSLIDVYSLDPAKNPIPSSTVTVERFEGDWVVVQTRQTNSQGFVRLGGQDAQGNQILREGYYRISVSKRGYTFQVNALEDSVEGWHPPNGPWNIFELTGTIAAFYFWGGSPVPTYAASGLIRTQWDRPVPDVAVTLTGQSTGRVFHTRTRSNGYYYQTGMPADIYSVAVEKSGWELTPVDPTTGWPDPAYEPWMKAGPPAFTPWPYLAILYTAYEFGGYDGNIWDFTFMVARDFAYQYPNGRQDYWAMPQ
ncbi:MAG: S8 family serine peptidase [Armatimonadota bacterium]|nr:MAG: S8 family serine peptidase [Armatimonadota bacterium]